ncbi:MAG: hypothetical protein WC741_01890 [Patescibacteria group bacterium]|jgi:hypothetical protein
MKNNYLITVLLVIVFAGIGFYGGIKYQQGQRVNLSGQFGTGQGFARNGRTGGTGGVGSRSGFRPVNGEIISSDSDSITVKLQDGSSRIVILSSKTLINKATTATISDLKMGEKVVVFGTDNADGSVTAQNVQLNPIERMGGGGRNGSGPTGATGVNQ